MSREAPTAPAGGLTLVCFAVKEEARVFQKFTDRNPAVSVLVTGMGRVNAGTELANFLRLHSVACVFTCGFAGALISDLAIGQVIYETADAPLREKLELAGVKAARMVCADRIAVTVADKSALRKSTGADAVEMESGAIQALCRERGIRCATVRAISDLASEDLPLDFNRLSRKDRSLDYTKLALEVIKRPGKISGLRRLQQHARLAAEKLADVLVQVIG